jgi:hypothetical protein
MAALKTYGSAAKEVLPALRDLLAVWRIPTDFPEDCNKKRMDAVVDAIRYIEAAREAPPLRTLGQTTSNRRRRAVPAPEGRVGAMDEEVAGRRIGRAVTRG